jgi:hypothetical protein
MSPSGGESSSSPDRRASASRSTKSRHVRR